MDEHRHLKIARREHLSNVGQMHPYLVAGRCVVWGVRLYFDCAAIRIKPEMVG